MSQPRDPTPDRTNDKASPNPSDAPTGDEQVSLGDRVVMRGGKVDPEVLRRLIENERSAGAGEEADDDERVARVTFTLQHDLQKRLDKYLTDRITFMSRNQLQALIARGGVTVNARVPKASTTLRKGDTVEVMVPEPPSTEIQPENIPIEVLFEDEHLIVINKSPDIIVHPARAHNKGTMVNALAWHLQKSGSGALSKVGDEFARPGVVHRLDRHTSGVIVFAKEDETHWKLGRQFEHRQVDKRYLALVHGRMEPETDAIEEPIGPHPSREKGYREKYVVRHDEQGKHALTIYRVREAYNPHAPSGATSAKEARAGERYTLVELELKTGRTHQIRVHLSHQGWSIVGDDMYGGRALLNDAGQPVIARQALHAAVLGFTHPMTGKKMVFTAPLRGDMASAIRLLRAGGNVTRAEAAGATVDLDRALSGV
jgi:23S rRNA pseudouridine1911/1915/1917 synthase